MSTDLLISSRCYANSVFHPSEVRVPDSTGANSGSSTMRVAPIDNHWWYDWRLKYLRSQGGRSNPGWLLNKTSRLRVSSWLVIQCFVSSTIIGTLRETFGEKFYQEVRFKPRQQRCWHRNFFCLIKRNKNLSTSYLNDSVYIQIITNF